MIPENILEILREVMKNEGVVAIATLGDDGPHMVNTWNSYLQLFDNERLVIPVGGMNKTEANVAVNERVLLTLGSRKVKGRNGPGTGFLVKGSAKFVTGGHDFEAVSKFKWARAALVVTVTEIEQTL
ncbi:pyridoxamine 5'-phosphate oxidase family protein [Fundidesulfovibrio agrisoli]|uniref:pyridoxamine 5'-phosphate oxidase family protein n=1 Tax=Fundidesulfovibrio agrisoli TaxID=2922717 RepID=UPI001FAE073A|nr:pyridoxamine 5'-phosphate oxidase family protein [Fundidesulfovibrio agrisoli]